MLPTERRIIPRTLVVLTLTASVAVANADAEVRIWLTTQDPATIMSFRPGYGPFTPFSAGSNVSGPYDIHRNYVSTANPGDVTGPKFPLSSLIVEAPTCLMPGTPVYIWAAFCGPGDDPPPAAGLGWEDVGTKVAGLNLTLVTTGSLVVTPVWYQIASSTSGAYRWESTSDMTGDAVTLVAVNTAGFQNSAISLDRLQNNLPDSTSLYAAGAILLRAIEVSGSGSLQIGLGYNGMAAVSSGGPVSVVFFPGTENTGIPANQVSEATPPRVGQTAQATWGGGPISGRVRAAGLGVGGVTIRVDGAPYGLTNWSGAYCVSVPHNWSGMITPSKAHYTFSPPSREYTDVTTEQVDQDYTPIPEIDCNSNGVYDPEEILIGISSDCNGNSIPDQCELAAGTSQDCNANGIPDECDISVGVSLDRNSDGIPDECQVGDMNCDGAVNFDDINPFVLALVGHDQYAARHPNCLFENADINHDGFSDFSDINPFVNCLVAGRCP